MKYFPFNLPPGVVVLLLQSRRTSTTGIIITLRNQIFDSTVQKSEFKATKKYWFVFLRGDGIDKNKKRTFKKKGMKRSNKIKTIKILSN